MNRPKRLSRELVSELFGGLEDLSDLKGLEDDGDGRKARPEDFGLDEIDSGAAAIISAFPGRDDLVIRVSEEANGWISWACGPSHPVRPNVIAIAWTGDVWVSVCERMDQPNWEQAEAFCKMIERSSDINDTPEDPDLGAALAGFMMDDVAPRNVLQRADGQLVMNDPQSFMGFARMMKIKKRFDLNAGTAPVLDEEFRVREDVSASP